jgi:uncharacterized RDD family membrane protein YckC
VRCPRCGRESGERAAFCAGCGAPLALREEKPARPLDAPLALDRRAGREGRTAAPSDPTRRIDRSEPVYAAPEPAGPAGAVPPPWLEEPVPRERAAPKAAERKAVVRAEPMLPPRAEPGPGPGIGRVHAKDAPAPRDPRSDVSSWSIGSAADALAAEPASGVGPAPDTGEFRWGERAAVPDVPPGRAQPEIHRRRAPPWRRVLAWVVDVAPLVAAVLYLGRSLLGSAAAALPAPADGLDGLVDLVVREQRIVLSLVALLALALAVYTTLAHALAGATLGKWILGLRVVGPGGARPSLGRSALRSAVAVVSAALLGLGFLLVLFTRSGRALHDFVAGTWVVTAP